MKNGGAGRMKADEFTDAILVAEYAGVDARGKFMESRFVDKDGHLNVIGVLQVIKHPIEGDTNFKAADMFIFRIKNGNHAKDRRARASDGESLVRYLVAVHRDHHRSKLAEVIAKPFRI